jgi:hypothetical protein
MSGATDACAYDSSSDSETEQQCSFRDIDSDSVPVDTTDSETEDGCLTDDLGEWAASYNITLSALGGLLKILRKTHPELPKDPRTIMRPSTDFVIETIALQVAPITTLDLQIVWQLLLMKVVSITCKSYCR